MYTYLSDSDCFSVMRRKYVISRGGGGGGDGGGSSVEEFQDFEKVHET